MPFETIIGLEVHLKLNSPNKLFCRCPNVQNFDELEANTHVCPVCMGQPGALPVLSQECLELAIKLGLALGCEINEYSHFDRKSYFYPDLPLGYQITQQHKPTCVNGMMKFFADTEFSEELKIDIRDAHIETDTGKTTQEGEHALLDYNRAGTPLVEIVTQPDLRSDDQVVAFLKELQRIARYNNISDADMEKGQMRCDVNISLREEGEEAYRTRVELKNMSSFSAVRRAIAHEVERQEALYADGAEVAQETRGWDDVSHTSYVMRSKENAMDYRYMPEPDLPTLRVTPEQVEHIRQQGIRIPHDAIQTYKQDYGFNKEFINALIGDKATQAYFSALVADGHEPKRTATWIAGPILRWLNEQEKTIDQLPFSYDQYSAFLSLQQTGNLINQHAKTVMKDMLATGKDPQTIIDEKGLKSVDASQVNTRLQEIFTEKPDLLEDLKAGNMKPMGFIVGQVMKKSGGAADPKVVNEELRKMIG